MSANELCRRQPDATWRHDDAIQRLALELVRDGESRDLSTARKHAHRMPQHIAPHWEAFLRRISDWMGLYHSFYVRLPNGKDGATGFGVIAFRPEDLLSSALRGMTVADLDIEVCFASVQQMNIWMSHDDGEIPIMVTKNRRG